VMAGISTPQPAAQPVQPQPGSVETSMPQAPGGGSVEVGMQGQPAQTTQMPQTGPAATTTAQTAGGAPQQAPQTPEQVADQQYMQELDSEIDYWSKSFQAAGGEQGGQPAATPSHYQLNQELQRKIGAARLGGLTEDNTGKAQTRTQEAADWTTKRDREQADRDYQLALRMPAGAARDLALREANARIAQLEAQPKLTDAQAAEARARAEGTTPRQMDEQTTKLANNTMSVVAGYLSGSTRAVAPSAAAIRSNLAKASPKTRADLMAALRRETYNMSNGGDVAAQARAKEIIAILDGASGPASPTGAAPQAAPTTRPSGAATASPQPPSTSRKVAPAQGSLSEKVSTAMKGKNHNFGSAANHLVSNIVADKRVMGDISDIVERSVRDGRNDDQIVDEIMAAIKATKDYRDITTAKNTMTGSAFSRVPVMSNRKPRATEEDVRKALAGSVKDTIRKHRENVQK